MFFAARTWCAGTFVTGTRVKARVLLLVAALLFMAGNAGAAHATPSDTFSVLSMVAQPQDLERHRHKHHSDALEHDQSPHTHDTGCYVMPVTVGLAPVAPSWNASMKPPIALQLAHQINRPPRAIV
jgi:hypothetical protein